MSYLVIDISDELAERGVRLSEMCDDCNREATVFNKEGSYCKLHAACLECGQDEATVGRHCAECAAEMAVA